MRRPRDAFNGIGAELYGGRWNPIGRRAAYASATRSLAALEYLANVDAEDLPADLVFVGITFDEASAAEIANPPLRWDTLDSAAAIAYGASWIEEQRSPVLVVPSVIVRAERNYVVNPRHPEFAALDVSPDVEGFVFDARLIKH